MRRHATMTNGTSPGIGALRPGGSFIILIALWTVVVAAFLSSQAISERGGLTLTIFALGTVWIIGLAGILLEGRRLRRVLQSAGDAERERELLIAALRKAMGEIKVLGGLIPICAACRKVRDDRGYWKQLEVYVSDHSDADFSHGLCEECAAKYLLSFNRDLSSPPGSPDNQPPADRDDPEGAAMTTATRTSRILMTLLTILAAAPAAWAANPEPVTMRVGHQAMDFTLSDPGGTEMKLYDLAGKVVVLSFWECYADSCFSTTRAIEEMIGKYPEDTFAAVSICGAFPSSFVENGYEKLVRSCGAGQIILLDPEKKAMRGYSVTQTPMTFVIGRDGMIRKRAAGLAEFRTREFVDLVETLVNER